MAWRYGRVSGYLGAVVLCGGCVARTCLGEARLEGSDTEELASPQKSALVLKQVQVFFRHGARTPVRLIPNVEQVSYKSEHLDRQVPHTVFDVTLKCVDSDTLELSPFEKHYRENPLKGGCYFGMLTPFGQQQMYEVGRTLRRDYMENNGLLDPVFTPQQIYVRSTNINRTIASARCVLAGLYGVQQLDGPQGQGQGQGVIHVSNLDCEVLLPNPHNCEVVKTINHAALIHFDNIPGIQADRLFIENLLGVASDNPHKKLNFIDIRDDLVARQTHGLPLPEDLLPHLKMIERNATRIMYHAGAGLHRAEQTLALRMNAGPALTLAVDEMKAFIEGTSGKKMCLYSAHDSLVMPLTVILGISDHKWPPFAADIRLELYVDSSGEHWVRALYCGKVRKIGGMEESLCKFSKFLSLMEPYLIDRKQYKTICKSNILQRIAKDLLVHDEGEEKEDRSDVPAGL